MTTVRVILVHATHTSFEKRWTPCRSHGVGGNHGFMERERLLLPDSALLLLFLLVVQLFTTPTQAGCASCVFMVPLAISMYVETFSEIWAWLMVTEYQYPDRYSAELQWRGFCL